VNIQHPEWCDPRCCAPDRHNVDHRATPLEWKVNADDVLVTVGLSRYDCADPEFPAAGQVLARLGLRGLVHDADGDPATIEMDLSSADARLLAAALACVAEQLDAERAREVSR
jgi:hypothetical protein